MKWRLSSSVLLLAASVSSASAQTAQPDALFKLDELSRRQILLIIDSARSANLPAEAIRLRAVEGANKRRDGKQVVAVVRQYYQWMIQARAALGPLATAEDIESGADVLAAHVSAEELGQFRVTAAGRSPMRALVYLTDLIDSRNVPREEAVSTFAKIWKEGAADSDFEALWRGIGQDILGGVSPRAALRNRAQTLPSRLPKPPTDMDERTSST